MTVKILLLKSGEDVISDVKEMVSPDKNVIGVTSVIQKDGVGYQSLPPNSEFMSNSSNKWYEVDALALEDVFIGAKSFVKKFPNSA